MKKTLRTAKRSASGRRPICGNRWREYTAVRRGPAGRVGNKIAQTKLEIAAGRIGFDAGEVDDSRLTGPPEHGTKALELSFYNKRLALPPRVFDVIGASDHNVCSLAAFLRGESM